VTVSKRFAIFRRGTLGLGDDADFDSLRRCFANYRERASTLTPAVNASAVAELMGHAKPTLALSLYSGGLAFGRLRAAVDSLDLVLEPEVVEPLAAGPPLG
jgi:hypothetical protein